jgi:hypothetical protein
VCRGAAAEARMPAVPDSDGLEEPMRVGTGRLYQAWGALAVVAVGSSRWRAAVQKVLVTPIMVVEPAMAVVVVRAVVGPVVAVVPVVPGAGGASVGSGVETK